MTNHLIYLLAKGIVGVLTRFPLPVLARIGRWGGSVAYRVNRRHRQVALHNLHAVYGGEKSPEAIRRLTHENFRRIGETYASAVKTATMPREALNRHLEVRHIDKILARIQESRPQTVVLALGHFGNFELLTKIASYLPDYDGATTYRALQPEGVDRVVRELREQSGCLFFERRTESRALTTAMAQQNLILGLLADQDAGSGGLQLPFLGRKCSTSPAPAILALRHRAPLFTAICYRIGCAQWRVEIGDEIPIHEQGQNRSKEAIMRDVNRAFETAVRRDPANWFWVHRRWKSSRKHASYAVPSQP